MPSTTQREDYGDIIKDLRARLDRLETAAKMGSLFIRNSAPPPTPVDGGIIFVQAGALKYKGSSGTITTIGPA